MSLPKEIQKIYNRIDKVAKGGRDNFLQYHSLIDEYIAKGSWDNFKQCLYLSYGLDVDDLTSIEVKKETWTKILFRTNTTLQDQKYSLFKNNGVYNQGLGYYVDGSNPTRKLGEIREISQSINPNDYQSSRNYNILDAKRTSLEVIVNQVIPETFLGTNSVDFISSTTQSTYLENVDSRERISSGLTVLDVDRKYIYRIISNPNQSLSFVSEGRYTSLFDQKLEIDFEFDVFPYTGTGSIFVSLFNYNKSTSKFIDFSVGSQSYYEYFYTSGSTFSISGGKIIDVNQGESIGISIYKDSIVDIDFRFSNVRIDFISYDFKECPLFLNSDDIDWIKSNNSFRLSQSVVSTATVSQRLQSKVVFSDWDISKTYDRNMIDLYTQAIEYLI